jgi:hypothetical protein
MLHPSVDRVDLPVKLVECSHGQVEAQLTRIAAQYTDHSSQTMSQ